MPLYDRRVAAPGSGRAHALWLAIAAAVLAGCGVLELGDASHAAVVLEPAQPAGAEQWTVVVELLETDISGAAVVVVGFDGDRVSCVDGGDLAAEELLPSTELRFEQGRDEVQQAAQEGDPPMVSGVDLTVDCD